MLQDSYSQTISSLDSFNPKIWLAMLGITDFDLARYFAYEFEPETTADDVLVTKEKERELVQKAQIYRFTRISKLLALLRRDLLKNSEQNIFVDVRSKKAYPIRNQEIFSKEIVANRSKILGYIAKAHGRCLLLIEYLSLFQTQDPKITEILNSLKSWVKIFDQISYEFSKGCAEDREEYAKKLILSKKALKHILDIYQKKYGNTLTPENLQKLVNALDPKFGSAISNKLLTEYIDSSLTLGTMRILNRLSAESEGKDAFGIYQKYPEINLPEVKSQLQDLYSRASVIKNNVRLAPEFKKNELNKIDQKFKELLIPIGNKISLIFPHLDESEGDTLVDVLKNENAVCAGKAQIVRLVGDYLRLKNPSYTYASHNNNGRHTFNLFDLPSGNKVIIDCNFLLNDSNCENKFTLLSLEEVASDPSLPIESTSQVFDGKTGRYVFYRILDQYPKNKFDVHRNFHLVRGNSLISPLTIANFYLRRNINKYQDYLRVSGFPNSEIINKDIESLFTGRFNYIPPFNFEGISESEFIRIIQDKTIGYSLEILTTNILLSNLKKFKNTNLLEQMYLYLNYLYNTNPLIFKFNYYNEVEKLNYLKKKLGKV